MIRNSFLIAGLAAIGVGSMGLLSGCNPGTPEAPKPTDTKTEKPTATTAGARPEATDTGVKAEGDTIKIGLVAAKNGDDRPWGIDSEKGAMIAQDEINAAGGINGKKVQILVGDSASTPEGGKSAAEKLVSDGVVAILGEVASGTTALIEEVAFAKGIPVVTIGSTRTDLAAKGNNFFRVCYNDDFQGSTMAKFAFEGLKLHKVAIMTDNKLPYSQGLSKTFREAFTKLGGEIVDEQFYEKGQAQFSGQVENMKGKNPEGIFLSGYFTEVGAISKAIRGAGMKDAKLFGGDGWDSPSLITGGGEAIVDGHFCNHYNNADPRPEVQGFITKWKDKNNGAAPGTTMGALAYDAANMTFAAMKRCKDLTAKNIIAELENTENFPGVTGKITLKGQGGNPKKDATVVRVTKDGFTFAKTFPAE
ncbi:MAG: ABC transporter substrate-binding protein [Armatimonadetes bacterium]|nr:ABC transporter substrate-binding protein [Armatimonadota bacterium]